MIEKLTNIDNKIQNLKQKKQRIQNQQAILLMREAQKILKEDFTNELVLHILQDAWHTASKTQKTEWATRANSFPISNSKNSKKIKKNSPAAEQIRKAKTSHHEQT